MTGTVLCVIIISCGGGSAMILEWGRRNCCGTDDIPLDFYNVCPVLGIYSRNWVYIFILGN
jgi:hypothetical protein